MFDFMLSFVVYMHFWAAVIVASVIAVFFTIRGIKWLIEYCKEDETYGNC